MNRLKEAGVLAFGIVILGLCVLESIRVTSVLNCLSKSRGQKFRKAMRLLPFVGDAVYIVNQ